MSQKRLSMRKIRELMRLKYELGRSHRETAASLGVANSTVSDYAGRARAAGLSWPLPEGLDDDALEAALFPPLPPSRGPRPEPDWDRAHRELQRHKGVTLRLLWLEYRTVHPDGYGYSRFCDRYARRGTLLASQVPVEHWHDVVGDPTFGDAILDRLLNNAHKITLKGASTRRLYDSTKTGTSR